MKNLLHIIYILLITLVVSQQPDTAGFRIGNIRSYKLIAKHQQSAFYQIQCPQIQDGRPMKLIQLIGSHQQVGYAYGALLGPQIIQLYNTFLSQGFSNPIQRKILQIFLDWQFDTLVSKEIPIQFGFQLRGLQKAGMAVHKTNRLRDLIQRVLVISSYPGDFGTDITYAMVDAFLQEWLKLRNPKILNYVENNMFAVVKMIKNFMNRKRIHCSFMAAWGSRTKGGKLLTMRNLDWEANTGINKHKLIMIWKITDKVPHATIGYPGVMGALTGMSQAGLTVHEAGLDSMKATQLGFQWTLRLRYILMNARNLQQAKQIWLRTNNTFGMNHMVASAADVPTGNAPAFVVETMRGYNAFFADQDKRQDGVNFTDPQTKQSFRAGYAMKDAVFRTNHAYDPIINKYRTKLPQQKQSTIKRYFTLKDSILRYQPGQIGQIEAVNITANVAHKGGSNPYKCPPPGQDNGTNVISVMFVPGEQRMYAAIEYGSGNTFQSACCGVYLHIDLKQWFAKKGGPTQ